MKMLFFSTERAELDVLCNDFVEAGIPCEIREGISKSGPVPGSQELELWILNDGDAYRALTVCVELGHGFAKRAHVQPLAEPQPEPDS
jgi:hypothetical protein